MTHSSFQIWAGVRERGRVEIPQFCYYQLSIAALLFALGFSLLQKKKNTEKGTAFSLKNYVRNWKIITTNTLSHVYSARHSAKHFIFINPLISHNAMR